MLTAVQQSQYGIPVFIIPEKEGTISLIIYYCTLNHKLDKKPYPLPIIVDTM